MTAARVNMQIDQGADFTAHIYWLDQDSVPFTVLPPIRMELRSVDANQLASALQVGSDEDDDSYDIVYNSENGLIQIYLSSERTTMLSPGMYKYDIFTGYLDSAAGKERIYRLLEGTVEVRGRITRNV